MLIIWLVKKNWKISVLWNRDTIKGEDELYLYTEDLIRSNIETAAAPLLSRLNFLTC